MSTTQQHLLISDIKDDILLLKNGGGALVLQVSAVNFGLLSDREQDAIIFAFAQMLNSLSFSIQIMIFSERLNITSYLNLLDKALKLQTNPLLSQMISNYKQFIQTTIKENDVLDKKIFVVVPLFPLELGVIATKTNLEQKIRTILLPRQEQIIRQLSRIGLQSTQLNHQKLVELFYDIYNGQFIENVQAQLPTEQMEVNLKQPKAVNSQQSTVDRPRPAAAQSAPAMQSGQVSRNHPFVVEELE